MSTNRVEHPGTMTVSGLSRRSFIAGTAGATALMLTACNQTKAPTGDAKPVDTGSAHKGSGNTLKVICTNESYKKLFQKFTDEMGSPVEFVSMSSGEALSQLKAAGKPAADLWFGGGIDSFMVAQDAGYLEQVTFEAASRFATGFKDPNNYWFSKGLTIVGFIVNKDLLAEKNVQVPTSWADLAGSEYAGEVLMSTPAVSGTNYAAVNALLQHFGETDGWKYLEALNANIPFYTKRGSDPSTRVAAGEAAVGITYIDHTLDELLSAGNLELVYPKEGMPYMPDGVAVFKGADNVDDAKLFIEWLFSSDENLKALVAIDKKSTILSVLPDTSGIDSDYENDRLMTVDLSLYGEQRSAILERWQTMTASKEVKSK